MGNSIYCSEPYIKPDQRSRRYIGPPVSFVTVTKPTAHADNDVPLVIPIPFRWIMVTSTLLAAISDSLFLHFVPLNRNDAAGLAINMVGNEAWLPLCAPNGNKSKIGMGYIFENEMPPTTLYLDIGQDHGGAGGVQITFAVSSQMKFWSLLTSQ